MDCFNLVKSKLNLFKKIIAKYKILFFFQTQCSVGCGSGYASRSVRCVARTGEVLDDSKCTGPKPANSQRCDTKFGCRWKAGLWKPVSHKVFTKIAS